MPKVFFAVFTEGVCSVLCQGVYLTVEEAKLKAAEIRTRGGAPKIYTCIFRTEKTD